MAKKKKVILIVSLIVIAASGFGFVLVAGAFGFGPAHGHGFHKRGMPPFIQKEIGDFVLWRMDSGIETLGLSKEQQARYDAFRLRIEEAMEKGMDTRLAFKKQAMLEFEKQTPDLSVMAVEIKSHVEMMSSLISKNLTLFSNFYASLDDNQKTKIIMKIKERIKMMKDYKSCREG